VQSLLRIPDMKNTNDVVKVREAIANNAGVIACQIVPERSEANIFYDAAYITLDELISSIEDMGYTVI
jgi:copper chaperone